MLISIQKYLPQHSKKQAKDCNGGSKDCNIAMNPRWWLRLLILAFNLYFLAFSSHERAIDSVFTFQTKARAFTTR
jgi:hypothetical protein